ncbi:type VII secretion protein EccB [Streptomyces cavernicola]|uniref:Type VII secretion protein EccB n=1 Tax=Streptomyces cavernicola TaxID=3043613 RepID=A0ABT6SGB1_9ACTN|nr:type VII secretion protein EccB [Streptomyces sp. B-S-A6]MDI3407200.1 type VII secretion protein EccB [Streptomyces sp. B-S-A6]
MAKRRDELAAYTFARKRTVAAFLAPEPGGSEEGAPRPVRTVMPSLAVGVILVVGFIAWGVIKPAAPKGWDTVGEHVIVDKDSTTRYVVLKDKETGEKVLHPVLNYASAKLLLEKGKGTVLEVPGKEIDKSNIRHGSTIGIPYAPDRLPAKEDAEKAKTWAVCERPAAGGGAAPDRAVFVMNAEDAKAVKGKGKVDSSEALYVEAPNGLRFLVDGNGTVFRLGSDNVNADKTLTQNLRSAVIGGTNVPRKVSGEWLATLNDGGQITFPTIPQAGAPTGVQGLPDEAARVGTILKVADAAGELNYVVLRDRVASITPFMAAVLKASPSAEAAYQGTKPVDVEVSSNDVNTANGGAAEPLGIGESWPRDVPKQVNATEGAPGEVNDTSCSLFDGTFNTAAKKPNLGAWAGKEYPRKVLSDSLNAYVSSGSGLLFQEITGRAGGGGHTYLLTDTGLRYSLPAGNDNASDKTGEEGTGLKEGEGPSETDKARTRLGYEKVKDKRYVPQGWAQFIPKGPTLDTGSAKQAQSQ